MAILITVIASLEKNTFMALYKYDFLNQTTDNQVTSNCGDITFSNQGSNTVTINNTLILAPGQSLTLSGNAGELDITIYSFRFTVVTTNSLLVIIRKIYV